MATLTKAPETAVAERLVVFRLRSEFYGVDIFRVSEIVRPQATTRMPQSSPHVLGLMDLRGRSIPVVDLGLRLGFESADETGRSRVVVVETASGLVGLAVDEVCEVLEIDGSKTEGPPAIAGDGAMEFVLGVAKHGEKLIVLLDVESSLG